MFTSKREPEEYARALLSELKLKRVGDIEKLAAHFNIRIDEVDSEGFEGALIKASHKVKGIITVKRNFREPGRRKFTIAHEIGHFVLPGHGTVECCASEVIESWQKNLNQQEAEANRFAAELLLPTREIYEVVNRRKATIALAKELSAEFETSLTATTLKCVQTTEEACAVVWSVDGAAKWARRNENFQYFVPNGKLDHNTLAASLFSNSSETQKADEVFAEAWLSGDNFTAESKIWEDSISLPFYNAVLTILTSLDD